MLVKSSQKKVWNKEKQECLVGPNVFRMTRVARMPFAVNGLETFGPVQ